MQKDTDIFEKLNNHRLPTDESYWAEMEKRLLINRKRVVPLWLRIAGAGIAASLALLFTARIFNSGNENISIQSTPIEQISPNNAIDKQVTETQIQPDNVITGKSGETEITRTSTDNTYYKNPRKSGSSASSVCQNIQEIQEIEDNDLLINNNIIPTEQDTTPEKQYKLEPKYNDVLIVQNEPEKRKSQNKRSWQIAAAFGSNVSNSSNSDLAFLDENSDRYSDKSASFNTPPPSEYFGTKKDSPSMDDVFQEFPEVTHLPPLSFGITIRKNFNNRVGIETGLIYSFLQSKFKDDNQWQRRDATLKLHYLGIPLNVVAYTLNKPKWNVYFSLGGMMEKGIMLDYVQHTTYQNNYRNDSPVHTVSLQENIPELQWSLNTSFGVDYTFYRDISIYFEPRIVYYFKNNQPVSVRTETPLIVGLNAGLRFEF